VPQERHACKEIDEVSRDMRVKAGNGGSSGLVERPNETSPAAATPADRAHLAEMTNRVTSYDCRPW